MNVVSVQLAPVADLYCWQQLKANSLSSYRPLHIKPKIVERIYHVYIKAAPIPRVTKYSSAVWYTAPPLI